MQRIAFLIAAALAASDPSLVAASMGDATPLKLTPSHQVQPEFPRAARRAGVEHGVVTARMTLDSDGKVTRVDIVQSEPRRVFDDAVTQALSQWRYPDGRSGRVVEIEVGFKEK